MTLQCQFIVFDLQQEERPGQMIRIYRVHACFCAYCLFSILCPRYKTHSHAVEYIWLHFKPQSWILILAELISATAPWFLGMIYSSLKYQAQYYHCFKDIFFQFKGWNQIHHQPVLKFPLFLLARQQEKSAGISKLVDDQDGSIL